VTLHGPDGSKWQAGIVVPSAHWDAVAYVVWRASIGTRSDRSFASMRDQALTHRKAFCAYHFVYPCGSYPAAMQAATFHAQAGDTRIPAMLDWESDGSLAATWDDVLQVADAIRRLGHRVPLVYTGKWYWQAKGSPTMSGHGFDLVNAHYGSNPTGDIVPVYVRRGGDSGPGWTGYGGLSPIMWQFGSRVTFGTSAPLARVRAAASGDEAEADPARPPRVEPGRNRVVAAAARLFTGGASPIAMDMNAIRSTRAELHRWFHDPTYVPPTPPPPPPPRPPAPTPPAPKGLTMQTALVGFPTLKTGSTGKWVKVLQSTLNVSGAGLPVTGAYDAKTVNVVKYCQGANGLPQTGVVDMATWAICFPKAA
jgi:hypothetical protein